MSAESESGIVAMGQHVGRTYRLPVRDGQLMVPVKVQDVRMAYGYTQLKVTPAHDRGEGSTWVNLETLET